MGVGVGRCVYGGVPIYACVLPVAGRDLEARMAERRGGGEGPEGGRRRTTGYQSSFEEREADKQETGTRYFWGA